MAGIEGEVGREALEMFKTIVSEVDLDLHPELLNFFKDD